jgi:hypothetical protein
MSKVPPRKQIKKKAFVAEAELPQSTNYLILIAGVLTIIVGYVIMSMGDATSPLAVTVAPIILVIGYCVVVPLGIIYRKKRPQDQKTV